MVLTTNPFAGAGFLPELSDVPAISATYADALLVEKTPDNFIYVGDADVKTELERILRTTLIDFYLKPAVQDLCAPLKRAVDSDSVTKFNEELTRL